MIQEDKLMKKRILALLALAALAASLTACSTGMKRTTTATEAPAATEVPARTNTPEPTVASTVEPEAEPTVKATN